MRTDAELREWVDATERAMRRRLATGNIDPDSLLADVREVHDIAGDRGVRLLAELEVLNEESTFRYLEWSQRGAPWMPCVKIRDKISQAGVAFRDLVGFEYRWGTGDNQEARARYDETLELVEARRDAKASRAKPKPTGGGQADARRNGVGFTDTAGTDGRAPSRGPAAATYTGEDAARQEAAYVRLIEAQAARAFGGGWS